MLAIVNQNVSQYLLLTRKSYYFSYKIPSYLDIFWFVVGGGGYNLAVGGLWAWYWIYFGWWWVVVGGGGYILAVGGWW